MDLFIIAGGGHGKEVYSYLCDLREAGDTINLLGVIDEVKQPGPWEESHILGDFRTLTSMLSERGQPVSYLTAVGDNRLRQRLAELTEAAGQVKPWTLRHPSAYLGREVEVGGGTLLAPGCIVTTRVTIGRHCILNVKASVSHDSTLGDFVNLNPGVTVCGGVRIGQGAFIGTGATVINGVSVGDWSVVGAGTVIIEDIPPHVTAVGVPARVIKRHPHLGSVECPETL